MIDIVLLRHGPTIWNELNRYQGRTDIPLESQGRASVRALKLPEEWKKYRVVSSPLLRAQHTAEILFPSVKNLVDSRLVEMDFGQWEGKFVAEIRANQDFSPPSYGWTGWNSGPPGGETYDQVARRFQDWLMESLALNEDTVAITHKGVILTAMALASNWDLASKRPFKILKDHAHVFTFSKAEGLKIKTLNLPLI